MKNRIICIFFVMIIILVNIGCAKTQDPLKEEKEKAIFELDDYYNNLDKKIFIDQRLESARIIITRWKKRILKVESKDEIRVYLRDAIEELKELEFRIKSDEELKKFPLKTYERFSSGTGTEEDPYIIDTPEELLYLSKEAFEGNSEGIYYELGADIDLKGMKWIPIGYSTCYYIFKEDSFDLSNSFKGYFDGKGHLIKNLEISDLDYYCKLRKYGIGLFGANSGEIKNVGLVDFSIGVFETFKYGQDLSQLIGSICAINDGTINNCYTVGSIDFNYFDDDWDGCVEPNSFGIGKMVGWNLRNGFINNCFAWIDLIVDIEGDNGVSAKISNLYLGGGKYSNCLVVGKLENWDTRRCDENRFTELIAYYEKSYNKNTCSDEDLNDKSFYVDKLGWEESIWDLDDVVFKDDEFLDGHYPKLRIIENN